MKLKITTGYWDGKPIQREETAEETLKREMKMAGNKKDGEQIVSEANLFIAINELTERYD